MNSNFRFFKWGFFLLVALNITLIVLLLFPRERDGRHHGPPNFDRIIAHLDESLKLSPKQHDDLVKLFDRHKKEKDSLHEQSDRQHTAMIECLKSGSENCEGLSDQPSFDKILFEHHKRIIAILNPAQKKQYLIDIDTHRPPGPPF